VKQAALLYRHSAVSRKAKSPKFGGSFSSYRGEGGREGWWGEGGGGGNGWVKIIKKYINIAIFLYLA
jgi:hypothetical protein